MKVEELEQEIVQQDRLVEVSQKYWLSVLPTVECPRKEQFCLWLRLHKNSLSILKEGLDQTAKKYLRMGQPGMNQDHCIRFASKVMNTCHRAAENAVPALPEHLFVEVTP